MNEQEHFVEPAQEDQDLVADFEEMDDVDIVYGQESIEEKPKAKSKYSPKTKLILSLAALAMAKGAVGCNTLPNQDYISETEETKGGRPTETVRKEQAPTSTSTTELSTPTYTPEPTVSTTFTPTATEISTPTQTPTPEFRRDMEREEAEALLEKILSSDTLREKRLEQNINKVYTVDPSRIYFSKIFSPKEDEVVRKMSVSLMEATSLDFPILHRRTVTDQEGNTIQVGVVGNACVEDYTGKDCNRVSVILSVADKNNLRYDFAEEREAGEVLTIIPIFFNHISQAESDALALAFQNMSTKKYENGEEVRFSEMINYEESGYNLMRRLYEGHWDSIAVMADHISRKLVHARVATEIAREHSDERLFACIREGITPYELYEQGASLRREGDEQIGDVIMRFDEDVAIKVDIYTDKQKGKIIGVISFVKPGNERGEVNYTINTIDTMEEFPVTPQHHILFGKPSNLFGQ
ncbi:hypothetical protein KBG23_01245 [Candidatus Dojkabacteria bacterium]|nr:hypothetical protein [Candidatus Dojkabacteria bacterium]